MEDILRAANDLGLLIKGTELYRRYEEVSLKLDADAPARELLEEYAGFSETMYEKESRGAPIEPDEKKRLQELTEKVTANPLLKEYIATQTYFMNLMMQVQQAISNPKGEPRTKSGIVTPGSGGGKIITGF